MSRLTLYTVFHCNLSFSALPEEDVPVVVARCYHPLLDLCERHGLPLGVELSATTLATAGAADPTFVERLVRLVRAGRAELVGSGLVQSILPLVPAAVNRANLSAGLRNYRDSIGTAPTVAYLNEQVWSDGLPRLYAEHGFRALVADWWNASVGGSLPASARYRPTLVRGSGGVVISVLWNDTEIFQKVQRYAHGRLTLDALVGHLEEHLHPAGGGDEPRALALYGGDAEIFDYRPGRDLFHHPDERPAGVEWARLAELVDRLRRHPRVELALPSQVLERFPPGSAPPVRIADAAYPVRTKKQTKYNVVRWAVTGRADTAVNTRCHRLHGALEDVEALSGLAGEPPPVDLGRWWEELVELWGSDWRTHISDRRFEAFGDRLGELAGAVGRARRGLEDRFRAPDGWRVLNPGPRAATGALRELEIRVPPGACPEPRGAHLDGAPVPVQWEDVERHADGSVCRARLLVAVDLPPGGAATLRLAGPPLPRLAPLAPVDGRDPGWRVDTGPVVFQTWDEKPGTVLSLAFPGVWPQPLLGTAPHGTFPAVDLLADLFTGHLVLVEEDGRQVTDLDGVRRSEPPAWAAQPLRRSVEFRAATPAGELRKRYHVSCVAPRVDLEHAFNLGGVRPVSLRLGVATFHPRAFDRATLALRTLNGGLEPEVFPLRGQRVAQEEPVNVRVSARHCLGATGGWTDVLDDRKGVRLSRDLGLLYSVPLVHYEEVGDLAYLRVQHTVAERDETASGVWKGRHVARFAWEGFETSSGPPERPALYVVAPRA
jgi:hypothetical protein